jgi:hypothetical protein
MRLFLGSLTEVWKIGNAYRTQRGLPELDLSNWLRSPETLEYVKVEVVNTTLILNPLPARI